MGSPYHHGERAVQERAGLADQALFSEGARRREIPEVAADFLAERTWLVVGALDASEDPWCSLLTGPSGFLDAPGPRTLDVASRPAADDPLADALGRDGTRVGALAIDPATRRRMRINGVSRPHGNGLRVTTDQVYANCPKYIQKRDPAPAGSGPPVASRAGTRLTGDQRDLVRRADTFFVATADATGDADANHRGGAPGFVRVHSSTVLSWPDYVGNAMFNTLGNLWVRPRAGLLFPDWGTGAVLRLSGAARIVWDGDPEGTGRTIEFTVERVVATDAAGLLAPDPPDPSRFNPPVPLHEPRTEEVHP
ncbi:pyridoxamine 5'-phosphate oxidase family protein [Nocardiopsis sp. N85]|uniref:pyridoxamine 5'-phosphate oxidase family protein n=1 Tax=Nocardiopsis sp. N85 TaxID=3029400 RepID=UPI00237F4C25|nr:pyridoxamine 5'-phosphate oxidase family protein [Nocardiopsis sp. N85]MDE3720432.1 pyridoxamine 5'-phosphate oxidase family protein [Nocardiopsis sp. N85]